MKKRYAAVTCDRKYVPRPKLVPGSAERKKTYDAGRMTGRVMEDTLRKDKQCQYYCV